MMKVPTVSVVVNNRKKSNITNQNWNYANRMGGHLTPFKLKQATPFLDTYTYDTRNRLTGHTSAQGASQKLNLVNAYDDNGNIERLTRTLLGTTVDNLDYTYNGNRLVSINETAVGDANPNYETFKPIASGNYGYDNAGTLTNDPYKGLTITNNFLHLPQQITGASVNVTNTYSSTGQKVKAVGPTGTYDYLGAVVFKNNEIEFVSTPEGRTLPPQAVKQNSMRYTPPYPQGDTTNLFWRYEYTLKDHLGNLRVACRCAEKHTDQQEDHTDGYAPTVVQQTHYDAWGVRLPLFGNDAPNYGKPHDRYKFQGQEEIPELGWYDFGNRMYDPATVHWNRPDRFADKYYNLSPYSAFGGNPLKYTDMNGDSLVVLSAPDGAKGAGHAAVLIGNDKSGWKLFSKNGTNDNVGLKGVNNKGDDKGQKETAQFKTLEDFANNPNSPQTTQKTKEGKPEYQAGYLISSDSKTDAKMIAGAMEVLKEDYSLLGSSCIDVCSNALAKGGFDPGHLKIFGVAIPGLGWETPNLRYKDIKSNNKGIDVTKRILPKK